MIYKSQSATRVDLAGGTLDCWPLYPLVGDCQTVNLAISVYTRAQLESRTDGKVAIHIEDLKYKKEFGSVKEFFESTDKELFLVQKVCEYDCPENGFNLTTHSESPVGGGLGGSSSLCISLLKAINQWRQRTMSTYEMVTLAHNIEAKVILSPTGTQDYFPAIVPALNIIHYTVSGIKLETLEHKVDELMSNLFLVYTGKSHHSGINNWQVIKSIVEGDKSTMNALRDISKVAKDMAEVCRKGQWSNVPELFRAEFDARVRLCSSFSSPEIMEVEKIVLGEGGDAVKICGAGGGGCVVVWAAPHLHKRIQDKCRERKFHPIEIHPVTSAAL